MRVREIVKYLILLVVSCLSASCVFDADRCDVPEDKPFSVKFTVSLRSHQTRASWGEEYPTESAVPFDYRIMPEELRMVIYTDDGKLLGGINKLDYWPINESHTEFQFVGQLPEEVVAYLAENGYQQTLCRFMVLANCSDNLSGDEYITYSHSQLDPLSEQSSIPMWGVTVADLSPLSTRNNLDVGDISLLRAAAKVEVKLSKALKDKGAIKITSAKLKYYNQTGYVLPNGWSQATSTKSLDQENCARIYRHTALDMPFIRDEQTGDYYIYVTEYDNKNYSGERNKISLEFDVAGKQKYFEDAISFCEYRNGAPVDNSYYNIVRNHIYEFEILSVAGSSLVLDYTVANWSTEDWGDGLDYEEHDLSYPTYHNPVVPYDFLTLTGDKQATYKITSDPTMHHNAGNPETGGFHCYFQILAPENVEWKPGFMGTKENYQTRVYRVDKNLQQIGGAIFDSADENKQGHLGVCGAGEWFHIVVFPKSGDGADKTDIEFGISYYQGWTDQYINLYVNGEYGNIRWPNSGDNPKIIKIKHISANQG